MTVRLGPLTPILKHHGIITLMITIIVVIFAYFKFYCFIVTEGQFFELIVLTDENLLCDTLLWTI